MLDRAHNVKRVRPGQFVFGCPLCKSRRGRPISYRILDDGRALLWAFCGHSTGEVLAAMNLGLTDLFPEPLQGGNPSRRYPPSHSHVPASDRLELIDLEVTVVLLIADIMMVDGGLSDFGRSRLAEAVQRINAARDHGHVHVR